MPPNLVPFVLTPKWRTKKACEPLFKLITRNGLRLVHENIF
jgi:hypothetical protein